MSSEPSAKSVIQGCWFFFSRDKSKPILAANFYSRFLFKTQPSVSRFEYEYAEYVTDKATATGTSNWAKTLENRDKHPKKYLDYLCCPEKDKKTAIKHRYRETKGGGTQKDYVKFLRALIHDIAWKFDLPIDDTGQCASFTEYTDKPNRVLRNI